MKVIDYSQADENGTMIVSEPTNDISAEVIVSDHENRQNIERAITVFELLNQLRPKIKTLFK